MFAISIHVCPKKAKRKWLFAKPNQQFPSQFYLESPAQPCLPTAGCQRLPSRKRPRFLPRHLSKLKLICCLDSKKTWLLDTKYLLVPVCVNTKATSLALSQRWKTLKLQAVCSKHLDKIQTTIHLPIWLTSNERSVLTGRNKKRLWSYDQSLFCFRQQC